MPTSDDMFNTAIHESGHVVAHVALGVPFRYVTLRPRTPGTAGLVYIQPDHNSVNQGDDSDIITFLAGAFAEARHAWTKKSGTGDLRQLELDYYRAETSSSDYQSTPIPLDGSLEAHWNATHDLVERRWPEILRVAERLTRDKTLASGDVRSLCAGCDDTGRLSEYGLLNRVETRRAEVARLRELFRQPRPPATFTIRQETNEEGAHSA